MTLSEEEFVQRIHQLLKKTFDVRHISQSVVELYGSRATQLTLEREKNDWKLTWDPNNNEEANKVMSIIAFVSGHMSKGNN